MSKFEKVADKRIMVRFLELDGNKGYSGDGLWATCSQAVKDFAEKTFKKGDDVHVQYEQEDKKMAHVTRIEKGTGEDVKKGATTKTPETKTDKPKCKDCGKELKDAKYEKCWACNDKNPSKSKKSYGKSPAEQDSIKRQAIGKMTAQSLIAMQGQVDPNNIVGLIETLYKKYQELVG